MARGEIDVCNVTAYRKGRGQSECELIIAYFNKSYSKEVVLRTVDADGIAPIVAVLTPEQARVIASGLLSAAARVEKR
ncbi:MAG: hypothetical protein ISS72_03385 [Candidatus Brocadiae bacterium]|nr:hypothetical protein [Candidatus Brocadiia bacterium]